MRVGLRPTSSISMREPGSAAAATIQNAADEKSPGTDQMLTRGSLAARDGHTQAIGVKVTGQRL